MIYCDIGDCSLANNKCKECQYSDKCDYIWVSNIWKKNSELLTPLMPGWVKPVFKNKKIISFTGNQDFCIFNISKKTGLITIQDICVAQEARGNGICKNILNYLMLTYDTDIIAKCVKDSSAESFWSHVGKKLTEEQSKQRVVCTYLVENKDKKIKKMELF